MPRRCYWLPKTRPGWFVPVYFRAFMWSCDVLDLVELVVIFVTRMNGVNGATIVIGAFHDIGVESGGDKVIAACVRVGIVLERIMNEIHNV